MISWWLREAEPLASLSELRGPLRADVCIVGGGFTGLWTALEIKRQEPSLDVVLVAADVCGSGASGRNGGFAMTFWHHFTGLERACGAEQALWLARASEAAVAEIGEFCSQNEIQAHYRRAGWLWTATNQAQVGAWESTVAAIERRGEKPFERLDADEVAAGTGSRTHLAGVFEPGSATVQRALLARGLLRSPGDQLERMGWGKGVSISDSRLMVHYYRTTEDGRIAFGKGGGRLAYGPRIGSSFTGRSPIADEVARGLRATYPALSAVPITASWTGPIDRTVDGLPFFYSPGRPNLVCGAGYSGNGVGPSLIGGRILASMALGRDDDWARSGLVRTPPPGMPAEPFRYVGGRIVRGAVARKERAEDEDRYPGSIDRGLAGLAPAGLVPLD